MAGNQRLVKPEPPPGRSPFPLQSLCRLVLMPGFRISSYARQPYTEDVIQLLGHAARLNCLKSITMVNIDRLDLKTVEQTDLESFLRVVKYNINVSNVKSVEKLFSAAAGVVPFEEEEPCPHHTRQICTKCDRGYSKDFYCPCQPFWTPREHHGRDYSDCTCRKRGLHMSFEGLTLSPAHTRAFIHFLRNVTEVRVGPYIDDGKYKWEHIHLDTQTLEEEIVALRNTSCMKIEFRGNWRNTYCDQKSLHVMPDTVKVCAEKLGWNYMTCDVGLQIWSPNYRYGSICHCKNKQDKTCLGKEL